MIDPKVGARLEGGAITPDEASRATEVPSRSADPLAPVVGAAAAGDQAAARTLLEALSPALLRIIRGMLGSRHPDVEDVLQDALLRVLQALPTFRGGSTVTHFAVRIAFRAAADQRRREHRRREAGEAEPTAEESEWIGSPRNRQLLRVLLDELPSAQAESLVLHAVFDYSLSEVAAATGAPVNTVRSRIRLAKEALRRLVAAKPGMADLRDLGDDH
jgi:RNA polymerase sigma-70 factor (ECF subfamily)